MTVERLLGIPRGLRSELRAALELGDDEAASRVAERLRQIDPQAGAAIARAIRDCQIDELLTLLEQAPREGKA